MLLSRVSFCLFGLAGLCLAAPVWADGLLTTPRPPPPMAQPAHPQWGQPPLLLGPGHAHGGYRRGYQDGYRDGVYTDPRQRPPEVHHFKCCGGKR